MFHRFQAENPISRIHRLEGILEDRREWTNEDVKADFWCTLGRERSRV